MSAYDPYRTFARIRSVLLSELLSAQEMTIGRGLASPNQPGKGRSTTCQAGLEPELHWGARGVIVGGNRGELSGESQINGHASNRCSIVLQSWVVGRNHLGNPGCNGARQSIGCHQRLYLC